MAHAKSSDPATPQKNLERAPIQGGIFKSCIGAGGFYARPIKKTNFSLSDQIET